MRVISGKAKGRNLLTREGEKTRPTADYFKEMLFDCLQFEIPDCSFLDLFSGSGAMAIEALSRGAGNAVLVEQDLEAAGYIRKNLAATGLGENAELMVAPVERALPELLNKKYAFDFIFMDPPYDKGLEEAVFSLHPEKILKEGGKVIAESSAETKLEPDGWKLVKEKKNKKTKMTFWIYEGGEEA